MRSMDGMRPAGAFGWVLGLVVLVPALAFAEGPKPGGPHEKERDTKQRVKEAEEHLREERKEMREALRDGGSAEHIKELGRQMAEAGAAFADARRAEREAERARLVKRGYLIPVPKLRVEWRRHARRIAQLRRIRELAVAANDTATVSKVDAILAKENERHEHWIDKRRGEDNGAAPAASGAAVPASTQVMEGGAK